MARRPVQRRRLIHVEPRTVTEEKTWEKAGNGPWRHTGSKALEPLDVNDDWVIYENLILRLDPLAQTDYYHHMQLEAKRLLAK